MKIARRLWTEIPTLEGNPSLLVMGCDVSAGSNVGVMGSWPRQLASLLQINPCAFTRPNLGAHGIARNLYLTLPHLRPKCVVVVLPPPSYREIIVDGKLHDWTPTNGVDSDIDDAMTGFFDESQRWLDYGSAIAMIATVCSLNQARLFLSTWMQDLPIDYLPETAVARFLPFTLLDTPEGHQAFAEGVAPFISRALHDG